MNNQKLTSIILCLAVIASPVFVFAANQPQTAGSPSLDLMSAQRNQGNNEEIANNMRNKNSEPGNSAFHGSQPSSGLHGTTPAAAPTTTPKFNNRGDNTMSNDNSRGRMDNNKGIFRGDNSHDRNSGNNRNPGGFQRGDRGDRGNRGGFHGGRFPGEKGGRYYHGGRYYDPHQFRFRGYSGFPFYSGSNLYFDPGYFTPNFFSTCFPGGYFDTNNQYCLNLFWQGWNSGRVNGWDNNKWYKSW